MAKIEDGLGRLLPQAVESEKIILASILLEGEKTFRRADALLSSHKKFYKEGHALIYKAFKALVKDKLAIDIKTTAVKLMSMNKIEAVGGALYLSQITTAVGSGSNMETHARIVFQEYVKRELIMLYNSNIKDLYSGEKDIVEIRDNVDGKTSDLFITMNDAISAKMAISKTKKMARDIKEAKTQPTKKTYTEFDKIFLFAPDELIWVGAMRKSGKTKTTVFLMKHLLEKNPVEDIAVRWFSMEDPIENIWAHFGSIETGIEITKIIGKNKDGRKLTDDELDRFEGALDKYEHKDLDITYGRYTVDKLITESKNFVDKRRDKLNIIIVDNFYILAQGAKGNNTTEKESYIADKLQDLKTQTNENGRKTVIYVIDHLKKVSDLNAIKIAFRPTQDDLKGSGRKGDVLTQLISINKPAQSKEILAEEKSKGKILINGKNFERTTLIKRLIIYESLIERNNDGDSMLKMMADLGTMKFMDFKEFVGIASKVVDKTFDDDEMHIPNKNAKIETGTVDTANPFDDESENFEDAEVIETTELKDESKTKAVTTTAEPIVLNDDGDDIPF